MIIKEYNKVTSYGLFKQGKYISNVWDYPFIKYRVGLWEERYNTPDETKIITLTYYIK